MKYITGIVGIVIAGIFPIFSYAELENLIDQNHFSIIEGTIDDVISTKNMDNPIRQGSLEAAQTGGILRADKESKPIEGDESILTTITIIKNTLNYILGFLGLVSLIFFLYHGSQYITSNEEDRLNDAIKKIKQAGIAIGGIGISRFLVTFIFFVIKILVR